MVSKFFFPSSSSVLKQYFSFQSLFIHINGCLCKINSVEYQTLELRKCVSQIVIVNR